MDYFIHALNGFTQLLNNPEMFPSRFFLTAFSPQYLPCALLLVLFFLLLEPRYLNHKLKFLFRLLVVCIAFLPTHTSTIDLNSTNSRQENVFARQ